MPTKGIQEARPNGQNVGEISFSKALLSLEDISEYKYSEIFRGGRNMSQVQFTDPDHKVGANFETPREDVGTMRASHL